MDALLKTSFRPEFLNRLDEIVYYKPLSKTEIAGVVDLMLESLVQRLAAKQLRLAVTDAAKQMIVDGGYDPVYGARPLKRYIQQNVETLVARDIIQNDPAPGDTITVDVKTALWRWYKRKRRIRRLDISPGLLLKSRGPDENLPHWIFQCGTAIMANCASGGKAYGGQKGGRPVNRRGGGFCRGLLRCAAADHAVRGSGRRRTVVCGAHDGTAGQRVHAGRFRCAGRRSGGYRAAGAAVPGGRHGDTVLAKMTLAEKVGQMFIVRCPEQGAAEKAAEYHLGGYILFRENFEEKTPVQAAEMVRACQAAAALPMLVGVDEEGGTVNRISGYPAFRDTPFASPQELYQAGGFDAVREDALEKCAFLEELGVNVNFAPVCDVSTDPEDFIYKRSFGRNAAETAQYVRTVVETMGERGMGSVLKHFPGYGNNADTHTGIVADDRPRDSFCSVGLSAFQGRNRSRSRHCPCFPQHRQLHGQRISRLAFAPCP